jgi:hypothetical protein
LVEHIKDVVEASNDPAFIAEWKLPDGSWNGERLFQAARFGTEMQYQHLVFEEFARKVQPQVDVFLPKAKATTRPSTRPSSPSSRTSSTASATRC